MYITHNAVQLKNLSLASVTHTHTAFTRQTNGKEVLQLSVTLFSIKKSFYGEPEEYQTDFTDINQHQS